ncbi:MAG: amino acid ABC transporter ATP-binding protein [Planctomycetales bacterium]
MLRVSNLIKSHDSRPVLRGVSFALERGEVGALIGPSGSGKSTCLRCINGLETFEQGEIAVGDLQVPVGASAHERQRRLLAIRRRVGMVFQQFHLFPHLTVLGNVIEAPVRVLGLPRDEAAARAKELLDRVGMGDRLESRPQQLSGGQQQRVAIARALAMRPELMLFDEPTSGLDPKLAGEVLAVMADLASQGQTMLVVTHSMSFARRVATTVLVIAEGVIVESGPPPDVLDQPQHPATRELLQSADA